MSVLTDALIAEHIAMSQHIEELRRLADDCGDERGRAMVEEIDASLAFLERELLPHAEAEDAVLYPAVAAALGSPRATETMSRDHQEIRRLVVQLRRRRDELLSGVAAVATFEVRQLLYGLHAVISLHVAKEEELYVPILDQTLDDTEAAALLQRMHEVVAA